MITNKERITRLIERYRSESKEEFDSRDLYGANWDPEEYTRSETRSFMLVEIIADLKLLRRRVK